MAYFNKSILNNDKLAVIILNLYKISIIKNFKFCVFNKSNNNVEYFNNNNLNTGITDVSTITTESTTKKRNMILLLTN